MTRKKSKVKALALAVTCAILAGGYSGVSTVYAADDVHVIDTATKIKGTLTVKDRLNLYMPASDGTPSEIIETLDIARLSKINKLIRASIDGIQDGITAGDGSTIGGVGFTGGALTGVTSINVGTSNSKFSIATSSDESNMKLGYLTITATNDGVKFTDTNRDNSFTIADVKNIKSTIKDLATGYHSEGNVKNTYTSLGDKLKVYDKHSVYDNSTGNWSDTSLDLVTIKGDLYVADNYSTIVKEEDSKFYVKGSDGSLKAADGKFTVDADGALKAANNNFIVDNKGAITAAGSKFYVKEDGKVQIEDELVISHAGSGTDADPHKSATLNIDNLTAINKLIKVTDEGVYSKVAYDSSGKPIITAGDGSTIGGVTISGGQLAVSYSGAPEGIARVNVSDLYADHELVNDTDVYGNKKLKESINTVDRKADAVSTKTEGIHRIAKDFNGISKAGTSIENTLEVYENGTVIINDNTTQQVTIDSNGIKVGQGSAYINNEGFKAGADGKNSLTITGLKTTEIRAGNNNDSNDPEFFVDGGGNVVAKGTLSAAGSKFFVSSEGNITASGALSVAGDKFRVNADGSINANNTFNIDANGALRAANDKFTADKDGNVRAIGSLSAANEKFRVGTDGSINVNQKFIVDSDGKLTSASGSKIGDVTIDGESLSNGTNSIKVSELASDHALVNDATKGNESLYAGLGSVQTLAQGLEAKTAGIERDTTGTTIENTLKVGSDGTVSTVNGNFKVGADGNIASNGMLSVAGGAFTVGVDGNIISNGTLSVAGNKFSVDENGAFSAAGGNFKVDANGLITAGSMKMDNIEAADTSKGVTVGGVNLKDKTISAADGKFKVDADGALKAANNNFSVDKIGKLISASGSKIGDVTINGESLSNGTNSIKVSELADDHSLVNDAKKGNEKLYSDLVDVQAKAQGLDDRTKGITKDTTGTTIEGKLKVSSDGTVSTVNGNFKVDADGNIVSNGMLSVADDKFTVDADGKLVSASGSRIGDVTIDGESLSNGTNSIKVGELASDHALVNDATKGNESLYAGLGSVQTLAQGLEAKTAGIERDTTGTTIENTLKVGSNGTVSTVNGNFKVGADGNIVSNGTLSVAGGKFVVNAEGVVTAGSMKMDNIEAADTSKGVTVGGVVLKNKTISAADDKFTVDENGKLISASGSKIGDVTINGESLSNGTNSIKVSELADDHDLVNDSKKGNESLYTGLGNVQTLAQGLDTKTAGIARDTTGTAITTIENTLKVSSDGTVKINEGEDQQVIIDSNGIKVGKNSARMNDSYGFATTRDLYIGADSADAPTEAGSKFYVKGSDGSIKAANGKFTVDGNGDITASGLTTKKITAGKSSATDPEFMVDEDGNLTSKGKLSAAGGLFSVNEHGALSVGNGSFTVDSMGGVVTSGSIKLNHGVDNSTQLTAGGVSFTKDGTTTKIEGDTVTVSSSGVNKSFNLSDIADVGQNMTNLGNRIEAEENKRAQEVSRLDTAISEEKTKREQEVSRLDTAISEEKTKREQEVSRLDTTISEEKTKREQDVSRLDTAISEEKTKREQEVSRLDTAISEEKTKREQEVSRLDTAINEEKTKREQDVADLNGKVDAVKSRVDSINNDFNTAINDEKTKREQEVTRLDGRIDTVNTAISDEKTKREQEVTRLDGRIDDVNTSLGKVSDLEQIDDIKDRDEFKNDKSVVGGLKAEVAARQDAIADEAAARQADVARLDGRISDVSSRINKVGAMAAAISSLKTMGYDPESPTEFSVGLGQYKGETGVALGFFHYPNKNFMINVSLSTSSGEIMGGIGATWRFGHKSPQKLLEEQRAAQAEKEIAAAEAYKAARAAKQTK